MRHRIPALLAAALLGSAAAPAEEVAWTEFAPAQGNFRVELPGKPQLHRDERPTPLGSVRETRYWLRVDGAELAVETHDFPALAAAIMPASVILDQALAGVVEDQSGTVLEKRELEVQGAPAREGLYRVPGDPPLYERVQTLLVGSRIYLLTGTCTQAPAEHPAIARFFDSFRFRKDAEAPRAD